MDKVCRDPRWGRCYESYSEDPNVVREMTEIVPGLQGQIPSKSRLGVPYVAGKYVPLACMPFYFFFFQKKIIYTIDYIIISIIN